MGIRLASIGSINDNILNLTELCGYVIRFMEKHYAGALEKRYGIEAVDTERMVADPAVAYEILGQIAARRGCMSKGGEPDLDKAAAVLMDDFRSGRLGRVTLEAPEV